MKVKTEYQGMTATAQYLTVHFRLEVGGSLVRASQVKIRLDQIPEGLVLEALDRVARRKLIEIWSGEQLPAPWED